MKEELHQELAKLQGQLEKLRSAVEHIDDAKQLSESLVENGIQIQEKYNSQVEEIKEVVEQYEQLAESTDGLIEEISSVNFPSRLDKIDNTVSGINQGVQNVISKIENASSDLTEQATNDRNLFINKMRDIEDAQRKSSIIIYSVLGIILIFQVVSLYFIFS